MSKERYYEYGMRLRGFAPGCQPMQGLILRCMESRDGYYDCLLYNRKLTDRELRDYEMDFIQEVGVEI